MVGCYGLGYFCFGGAETGSTAICGFGLGIGVPGEERAEELRSDGEEDAEGEEDEEGEGEEHHVCLDFVVLGTSNGNRVR